MTPNAWYTSTSTSAPQSASASSPGTIRESSNSTAEASTAAVRPSVAAASRSASVSAGRAGTITTSSSSSSARRAISRRRCGTPARRHEARPPLQVERRQEAKHEPECVLVERDLRAGLVEPEPEALAHPLGLLERPSPLLVHVESRVIPRLHNPFSRDVGPRLMRVASQEQPLRDAERRVVLGPIKARSEPPRDQGRTASRASSAGRRPQETRPCRAARRSSARPSSRGGSATP